MMEIIAREYSQHNRMGNEDYLLDILNDIQSDLRIKTLHQYRVTAIRFQLLWVNTYLNELENLKLLVETELAEME